MGEETWLVAWHLIRHSVAVHQEPVQNAWRRPSLRESTVPPPAAEAANRRSRRRVLRGGGPHRGNRGRSGRSHIPRPPAESRPATRVADVDAARATALTGRRCAIPPGVRADGIRPRDSGPVSATRRPTVSIDSHRRCAGGRSHRTAGRIRIAVGLVPGCQSGNPASLVRTCDLRSRLEHA